MTATRAPQYKWTDLPTDHPMDRVDRRRIIGAHAMISHVFLHEGCDVPTHSHENEQFACVVSGRVRFGVGAEGSDSRYEVTLGPDEVLHLPRMRRSTRWCSTSSAHQVREPDSTFRDPIEPSITPGNRAPRRGADIEVPSRSSPGSPESASGSLRRWKRRTRPRFHESTRPSLPPWRWRCVGT